MDKNTIAKIPELALLGDADPFAGINLSAAARDKLLLETVGETFANFVPVVNKLSEFIGSYKNKLGNARLLILLRDFRDKHESADRFREQFSKLMATPSGINLLQKVISIVNADTFEPVYINLLATVLKKISDSDFDALFEEHSYVLSQIEKLTVQALLLLSRHRNWPGISFASTTTSGVTSGEGWDTSFATLYSNRINRPDEKTRARLKHVINELRNSHIISLTPSDLPLTDIGEEIYTYLS